MKLRKGYRRIERNTSIGKELTQLRISQGLTQREVAANLKRSKSYVCKMETTKRVHDADALYAYAVACGTRPEYLLGRTHQLQLPLLNALIAPSDLSIDPLEDITPEERQELIRYLAFLRLKRAITVNP